MCGFQANLLSKDFLQQPNRGRITLDLDADRWEMDFLVLDYWFALKKIKLHGLLSFIDIFIEIIIDSHEIRRKKIERSHAHIASFLQPEPFCKKYGYSIEARILTWTQSTYLPTPQFYFRVFGLHLLHCTTFIT